MALTRIKPSGIYTAGNYLVNGMNVSANLNTSNANLGNAAIANFFVGNGANLTSITGANVTGQVSFAATANSVAVSNVSGIGNIATVNLDGNASNILYGNGVFASSPVTYGNSNVATFLANYGSNTITTTGNVSVGNIIGNGQALTGINGSNVTGQVANALVAGTVYTAAQPNITSTGTLTSLSVSGNANVGNIGTAGIITVTGNVTGGNLVTSGLANVGSLSVTGVSTLGNVGNVKITGGTNGYVLGTDGAGNLSWVVSSSGVSMTVDDFTGDGTTTSFSLSTTPTSKDYTIVSLAGTFQPRTTYSVTGSTLTFSTAPPNTSPIEVTTFASGGGGGGGTSNARVMGYNLVFGV